MSEETQNTPFPDEAKASGAPVDSPTGETAGPPETDADAVQPPGGGYRRREFLGITVKVLAGAAVGLHTSNAWAAQGGAGNQGGGGIGNTINICNAANPNFCDGIGGGPGLSNTCTATSRNVCVGAGANVCKNTALGGNTCDAGGNECLNGADANTCTGGGTTGSNTCNGSPAGALGNECRGQQGANTCHGNGAPNSGNTCTGGDKANTCRQPPANGANTCSGQIGGGAGSNTCEGVAGANTCENNGHSNVCTPAGANLCRTPPAGTNVALPPSTASTWGSEGTQEMHRAGARLLDVLKLFKIGTA